MQQVPVVGRWPDLENGQGDGDGENGVAEATFSSLVDPMTAPA
jgi:hypothetical protein